MSQARTSVSAAKRRAAALEWLSRQEATRPLYVIGHDRESAADLVRASGRSAFGWQRLTLLSLASRLAREALLKEGRVPASRLALDAVWARVTQQLAAKNKLGRLQPIAARPGLALALAESVEELRLQRAEPPEETPELRAALAEYEATLEEQGLSDPAMAYDRACDAVGKGFAPVLLLDVTLKNAAERRFVERLAERSTDLFAVFPTADRATAKTLSAEDEEPVGDTPLETLQTGLFREQPPRARHAWTDMISAPGEGRECVELVRIIQEEAGKGVPYDAMAVLLRSPGAYRVPIAAALRRAGLPSWFAHGMPAPDPSGRALLSLLRCAEERLSARRFAEYLSLGEVPRDRAGKPPPAPPASERFEPTEPEPETETEAEETASPEAAVVGGTLREPWRWEKLIVDAAVIGGADRWRTRLAGLRAQIEQRLAAPDISESEQKRQLHRAKNLEALTEFAMPLLEDLGALPASATWGEWLERLTALATRALRDPRRVMELLQELAPIAPVGPVELRAVRSLLEPRLRALTWPPKGDRGGKVFVGPIDAARGLSFEVVLVPGLVERVFPQRVREDALLPDALRERLGLTTQHDRVQGERLLLHLAAGAAHRRVVFSYPRLDAERARPRVPSFYALEVVRSVEGELPSYSELRRRAQDAVSSRLGWPAPADPSKAIDETEFDLATIQVASRSASSRKGALAYLLETNPFLASSLRGRWARWVARDWTRWDGMAKPEQAGLDALAPHQLDKRSFSATALQHFAACPYRFFLDTVVKLKPLDEPEAVEQLDPADRGSLAHRVQFSLLTELTKQNLRVTPETLAGALDRLDAHLDEAEQKFRGDLAPAIETVWKDGIDRLKADLREWLHHVAQDSEWEPWRFELAFGLETPRDEADAASQSAPVELDIGLKLRGSIDLVEKSVHGTVRATDYKTGKARATEGTVVGGGRYLQPLLYALALEKLNVGAKVEAGRLFYCTQLGGYRDVRVPLDLAARATVQKVIDTIGQALKVGSLPPAPDERECRYCDYLPICGPNEEHRARRKPQVPGLVALRRLP